MAALLLAALAGCDKKDSAKGATQPEEAKTANVKTALIETKSARPYVAALGSLKPYAEVTLSAEVPGVISSIGAEAGSRVAQGTALATISETDYALEVSRAEAALRLSEANLENMRSEMRRREALYRSDALSSQQYDEMKTKLAVAEAENDRAKVGLDVARQRMGKTHILSPLSGVISSRKVSAGDYVREGMVLFTVLDVSPLKLEFTVPEKEAALIKVGQAVEFSVEAAPEKVFTGRVSVIYPDLDVRTRSLKVEAVAESAGGLLKPGMFANVTLYTGAEAPGVMLPITALIYEGDQVKIYVVEGQVARQRLVKLGPRYGEFVVAREGVKAGEQLVVVGHQGLADGVKVNVAR